MEKCYANSLGDCEGKLTREHFVSRGLLDLGQPNPNGILLGGELDILVPTNSNNLAVSKILCAKHNNDLSGLDDEAIKLATTIFNWNKDGGSVEYTIDGDLLLRWQLKSLLGLTFAKKEKRTFAEQIDFQTICCWAFGYKALPTNIGMAVPNGTVSFPVDAMRSGGCPPWVISKLLDAHGAIAGYRTWFYPMQFEFDLRGHPTMSQTSRFKPNRLEFLSRQRNSSLILNFNWNDWQGGFVSYKLD